MCVFELNNSNDIAVQNIWFEPDMFHVNYIAMSLSFSEDDVEPVIKLVQTT